MPFNKDIIIRVGLGLVIFVVFIKVVGPVIFDILKRKIPGGYRPENDIDGMIKNQQLKMRSQFGFVDKHSPSTLINEVDPSPVIQSRTVTKEVENLYKESRWGGSEFSKALQSEITKKYSYTLSESKVNAFILLSEKKQYLNYLSIDNQKSIEAIKHFLSLLMVFLIMLEEIRNREFIILERVAKKCHFNIMEFALALQLKVLYALSSKKKIKEERLFEHVLTLHQYSEDSMKDAIELILRKEANLWAKGHSFFIDELSIHLSYASFLVPTPRVQNKKDIMTAYTILNANSEMEYEDIKKIYKKMAMLKHPDKVGQMNLPKALEKKALKQFNHIQEAYDVITSERKK